MKCPKCGKEMAQREMDGILYYVCADCKVRRRMESTGSSAEIPNAPILKKKHPGIIPAVIGGIVTIAAIGFAGFSYVKSNDLQKENESLKQQLAFLQEAISSQTEASVETTEAADPKKTSLGLNETWVVEGQWSFTINSVTATAERNEFSDKSPAQVVIIDYTYENLGYEGFSQDLYFSQTAFSVIDGNGEMASTYPVSVSTYPTPTPIGAKCVGAQEAYGLNNQSSSIKIIVDYYGSDMEDYKATFEVPVQ